MRMKFKLTSEKGTLTIWARSKRAAESSACFDWLMGEGPIFHAVTVEEVPALDTSTTWPGEGVLYGR